MESDLFDSFSSDLKFDFILSNPPYIPIDEKKSIMLDVLNFEPHLALFLPEPELFYKRLLQGVSKHLVESGSFYMETHPDWARYVCELSLTFGFKSTQIKKDLSGKERFVKLVK
jgi:release factor glutamine methyltransferase